MFTMRAEITEDNWLRLTLDEQGVIHRHWEKGYAPPCPSAAMRKRTDEFINHFAETVQLSYFKGVADQNEDG